MLCSLLFFFGVSLFAQSSNVEVFRDDGSTIARSINNRREVTGYSYPVVSGQPRGFIRSANGTITRVMAPNATATQLVGINDQGDVIGEVPNGMSFLRSGAGVFTAIANPASNTTHTTVSGLNNDGYIVGSTQSQFGQRKAYLRDLAGAFQTLGEIFTGQLDGLAISSNNRIILARSTSPRYHISDASGNFPNFDFFIPEYNASQIFLRGINANNIVVGEVDGHGVLVRGNNARDFVVFDLPGAATTSPYGINDRNEIVGSLRDAEFRLSGFIAELCTPNFAATFRTHGSGEELDEFAVGGGVCLWSAETTAPWITLVKSLGAGSGTVRYRLAANTGPERQGRIRVGTREYVITQAAGSCTYNVTAAPPNPLPSGGGIFPVRIDTGTGCPWTAFAMDRWLMLNQTSGMGSAVVVATVVASTSASFERSTQISVAGTTFNLTQARTPCQLSLSRPLLTFAAGGGLETIRVTAPANCSWFVNPGAPWITSLGQNNGLGTADVTVRVERNLGTGERVSSISFIGGGQSAEAGVRQSGAATCTIAVNPDYLVTSGSGQTVSLSTYFADNCGQPVTSDVPWIVIREPNTGYSTALVAPNPTRLPRRGTIRVGTASLTVDQFGNVSSTLGYVPVTPCRLLDTRAGEAYPGGPPALQRFAPRTVTVGGRCGIPYTARAWVLAVTARPKVSLAYLSMQTFGVGGTSTLNSWDGRTVSNLSVLTANPSPSAPTMLVSVTDEADVTLDAVGYFADPAADSLVFYPLPPCRVVDTRVGAQPLVEGTARTVAMAGRCGVPATAAVVSLNVTSVPAGGQVDWLTVWPSGRSRPISPAVNEARTPTASATLVPLGVDGTVQMQASHGSDAVVDVNGYFALPSDQGLYFTALTDPCRIADTRVAPFTPALAAGQVRTIDPRLNQCFVPSGVRAHALNATAVPAAPLAFLSLFPAPAWQGNSTLNAFTGQVTANFALVPDTGLGIGALASGVSDVVLDSLGYFVAVPASMRRPALIDSFTLPPR